jgi:hypothetical protein
VGSLAAAFSAVTPGSGRAADLRETSGSWQPMSDRKMRVGIVGLWYPTHSTAFYVGVTGKRLTSVSCLGFKGASALYQPGGNANQNPFADEIALCETSEGGVSRMLMSLSVSRHVEETGRVFGAACQLGQGQKCEVGQEHTLDQPKSESVPRIPASSMPGFRSGA